MLIFQILNSNGRSWVFHRIWTWACRFEWDCCLKICDWNAYAPTEACIQPNLPISAEQVLLFHGAIRIWQLLPTRHWNIQVVLPFCHWNSPASCRSEKLNLDLPFEFSITLYKVRKVLACVYFVVCQPLNALFGQLDLALKYKYSLQIHFIARCSFDAKSCGVLHYGVPHNHIVVLVGKTWEFN